MSPLSRVQLVGIALLIFIFYLILAFQLNNQSNWFRTSNQIDQSLHSHHTLNSHLNDANRHSNDLLDVKRESVSVFPIFTATDDPFDSTGEVYYIHGERSDTDDVIAYPVCSFTHVCVTENSVLFRWSNQTIYQSNSQLVQNCLTKQYTKRFAYDLCYCFYPKELQPGTVDYELIQSESDQTIKLTWLQNNQRPGRPLRSQHPIGSTGSLANTEFEEKYFPHSVEEINPIQSNNQINQINQNDQNDQISQFNQPLPLPGSVQPPIYAGHYWSIHKYVAVKHHIGHWAQRLLLFSAAMQHFLSLPLPMLTGVIVQDTEGPMTEHEQSILQTALWSILTHAPHPIQHLLLSKPWTNQFLTMEDLRRGQTIKQSNKQSNNQTINTHPVCVERMSWIKAFGIFATNTHDTMAYRAVAYQRYGIKGLAHRCPPRRVTILTRHNRKILNFQEIIDYMLMEHQKVVRVVEINDETGSEDQIRIFAESGLLIASHSSQLVNVMFSHPRSAMIEVAPEYYNCDFSEYAHGMGVFFRYAFGGTVPNQPIAESMTDCLTMLSECEGDSHCILLKRFEPICKMRETCCKYGPGFYANMTAIKIAVTHAMNHLNWACGERW